MRQLLYVSSATTPVSEHEMARILIKSRLNNAAAAVTGLLWTDGRRFLQVLEGEHDNVGATLERIMNDSRHRAVVILHDREEAERSFGAWSMASVADAGGTLDDALRDASPVLRSTFEGFVAARKAA